MPFHQLHTSGTLRCAVVALRRFAGGLRPRRHRLLRHRPLQLLALRLKIMPTKIPLVLDIDFTLIHLEYVPNSIEVPGRTRSAWLAPQTSEVLGELQSSFAIILATARSWDGARWVADGLNERGVKVEKVVIEDGAKLGVIGELKAFAPDFDAQQARESLRVQNDWPAFEWQLDFESCAVARCQTPEFAAELMTIFNAQPALRFFNPRFYRDGRKVYILPKTADKWSALQQLLGARARQAAGVGDGENDLVWLRHIQTPATLNGAVEPVEFWAREHGLVSELSGHAGIADALRQIGERAR